MKKKKLDMLTKAKLIYSGELMIFAIVFLVFAILRITGVMAGNATRSAIFNWVTIFGGSWLIIDCLWALFSKKRRPKVALIDKLLHAPAGIYLVSFDIYCFVTHPEATSDVYRYGVPVVLFYLCSCYIFESIYHFFKPIPGLLEIEAAEKAEQEAKVVDEQQAEFIEPKEEETNNEEIK